MSLVVGTIVRPLSFQSLVSLIPHRIVYGKALMNSRDTGETVEREAKSVWPRGKGFRGVGSHALRVFLWLIIFPAR